MLYKPGTLSEAKSYYNYVLSGFLILVILSSLYNESHFFIYPSLFSYHLYLIEIPVFLALIGLNYLFQPFRFYGFKLPLILTALLALYIGFHNLVGKNDFNLTQTYFVSSFCFLILCYLFFSENEQLFHVLFKAIVVIAFIESLVCIAQSFDWLNRPNSSFPISGTLANPNVTAMFLAMSFPVFFSKPFGKSLIMKYFQNAALCVLLIALVLLKCRSAFIGVAASTVLTLGFSYRVWAYIKDKKNRSLTILFGFVFIVVTVFLSGYLYNIKKASAEGRKLIWSLSKDMVIKNPLFGTGYGSFEKEYNLAQSQYFRDGNGSGEQLYNASFTNMGYNEIIQNSVEGGLIGAGLLLALVITLLSIPVFKINGTKDNPTSDNQNPGIYISCYSGLVAFSTMGMVNFVINATPVMCLFILYSAALITHPGIKRYTINSMKSFILKERTPRFLLRGFVGIWFIITGVLVSSFNARAALADAQNNKARLIALNGDNTIALKTLGKLETELSSYESYWVNYGNILVATKNYREAIGKFDKAKSLTSNPYVYLKTGLCYDELGDYKHAVSEILIAKYIEPNRLLPRIVLINAYLKLGDTVGAVTQAKEIMTIKPKIMSQEAIIYKHDAMILLKKLKVNTRGGNLPRVI